MTPAIHVLASARAPERLAVLSARLDALGLAFEVTEGPDARIVAQPELEHRFGARAGQGASPATPGDMACTLGHLAIWRRITEGRAPAAIVLEDDARLSDDFATQCAASAAILAAHGAALLRLEARPVERLAGAPLAPGLWRLTSPAFGSAGYAVTQEGAAWLARRFTPPRAPADHLLWGPLSPARRALRPIVAAPAPVTQDTQRFPSLIATERDHLGTRAPTLRDRAGRLLTRIALATGRAERIADARPDATPRLANEPGTRL